MQFDPSAWWARAALAFAIGQCVACGGFDSRSGATGDDGGPGQEASADDGGTGADGSGEAGGDATTGPEPCSNVGAVRPCTAANGAGGAQTCSAGPQGTPVWGTCYSLACDATAQAQTSEACIPAGSFSMGGLDGDAGPVETDTLPAHMVTIRRRFYVDRYEVSYGDFLQWWNASPRPTPPDGTNVFVTGSGDAVVWHQPSGGLQPVGTQKGSGCVAGLPPGSADQDPANCVPWETALAYCMAEGKRLPTEAEWEWIATGQGAGNEYPWGAAAPDCSHAIFASCTPSAPQATGSCMAGDTLLGGVNGMSGNEAEWTLDFYPPLGCSPLGKCWPSYANDPAATTDSSQGFVIRGGSYQSTADAIRARARDSMISACPQGSINCAPYAGNVGFRCVRDER